jgi:hypothetical protein
LPGCRRKKVQHLLHAATRTFASSLSPASLNIMHIAGRRSSFPPGWTQIRTQGGRLGSEDYDACRGIFLGISRPFAAGCLARRILHNDEVPQSSRSAQIPKTRLTAQELRCESRHD